MSSTQIGNIIGGFVLILLAGILNGSWNASFSPSANLAVGRLENNDNEDDNHDDEKNDEQQQQQQYDNIGYHHAFALFQLYAALLNIPICILWTGGIHRSHDILSSTPAGSIVLVIIFSCIWGFGTMLFGLSCRIAGVGMGTNLSLGTVAILGSLLPLIQEGSLITPAGGVVCAGLVICCIGLWIGVKALHGKDVDENKKEKEDRCLSLSDNHQIEASNFDKNVDINEGESNDMKYSTWKKVLVCLLTGLCAVQLQFAFVFGDKITDLAIHSDDLPGSTPSSGGAALIWLLAISTGAVVNIANGIYSSPVPLKHTLMATPWTRHLRIILSTSVPWISHIHIYGVCATTLLPEKLAAAVGWPMLMMISICQSLLLSIFLGEWKVASTETVQTLKRSLVITFFGIVVLMTSISVPSSQREMNGIVD